MQQPNLLTHHAHLWIGDKNTLVTHTIAALQHALCPNNGCTSCLTCKKITEEQHAWISWIRPDGSYSLDQIDEILSSIRFKLDSTEKRFLIFTQADELTANCNNRLLKSIEEPHPGYFFIFLTSRTENILPTLISRCFVKEFNQHSFHHQYYEITQPFLNSQLDRPIEFMKLIDKHEIKERETRDIIDLLIQNYHEKLKCLHMSDRLQPEMMLQITDHIVLLRQALMQLPVHGSSKLFWKNLYLTFHLQAQCLKN